jgi:phage shock protein C
MSTYHRTLYRSRHGKIFGVIQGLSDYLGLNAFWLRVVVVIVTLCTWFMPMLIVYLCAALIMNLEPATPLQPEDEEFYNSMTSNRHLALMRLTNKLDALDRRAQRLENTVTAKGYDWDRRMRESR